MKCYETRHRNSLILIFLFSSSTEHYRLAQRETKKKAINRMDTRCSPCKKTFHSENALQQHLRDSPAHNVECEDCDRSFGSENALQQHLHDSPVHKSRSQVYASYDGFHNFVHSHGLKRKQGSFLNALCVHSLTSHAAYNLEDLKEAGIIADMMSCQR